MMDKKSQLTKISEIVATLAFNTHKKMNEDFGGLPLGQRPPTKAEREMDRRMFDALTIGDISNLTGQFGPDVVNKYISEKHKHRRT